MSSQAPFFILGCVRSGTTILRDVIASHPRLFCPNETHFFRFADPFGTPPYVQRVQKGPFLKKHRELDGVAEDTFLQIVTSTKTRRELTERYMEAYLRAANAPGDARWFDKTPQNIYGIFLIADEFPDAKFVHIVRNPLNVVASLKTSSVMNIQSTIAGANYWYEAAIMAAAAKKVLGERYYELTYEDFSANPNDALEGLMSFLGEDASQITFDLSQIKKEKNQYLTVLSDADRELIYSICGKHMDAYCYSADAPKKEKAFRFIG